MQTGEQTRPNRMQQWREASSVEPPNAALCDQDGLLVRKLVDSSIFRDYQQAFTNATGLSFWLQPLNPAHTLHVNAGCQSPLYALLAANKSIRTELFQFQNALHLKASNGPATMRSRYGINESAIPVKLGDRLIGYLHTGQVLLRRPTRFQVRKALRELRDSGIVTQAKSFADIYNRTPVVPRHVYDGIIFLLEFFASQLGRLASQIMLQETNPLPPHIARARTFIAEHYDQVIRLKNLANYVGISPFAFCREFKRATTVTFKDYVARLRVEKVKGILSNPKCRVSEAAYRSGFQSLSSFNRQFRRITGQCPTRFRQQIEL